MLVANSFDLWRKDAFFSAAEEVQQSADLMGSAYRTWLKARKEDLKPECLDELSRQLQMTLGTAKWQLEEFERAVNLSYRHNGNEATITRHKQFVSAIGNQISFVEEDLKDSHNTEGKNKFRWVNLDETERDDLAHFLSVAPETSSQRTGDHDNTELRAGSISLPAKSKNDNEHMISDSNDARCEDIICKEDRVSGSRRTCNSSEKSALEIIIDSDDTRGDATVEDTPKEKGSKPFFWRSRGENHPRTKPVLSRIRFNMPHFRGSQRGLREQLQQVSSPSFPVHSRRFVLVLLLAVFLVDRIVIVGCYDEDLRLGLTGVVFTYEDASCKSVFISKVSALCTSRSCWCVQAIIAWRLKKWLCSAEDCYISDQCRSCSAQPQPDPSRKMGYKKRYW